MSINDCLPPQLSTTMAADPTTSEDAENKCVVEARVHEELPNAAHLELHCPHLGRSGSAGTHAPRRAVVVVTDSSGSMGWFDREAKLWGAVSPCSDPARLPLAKDGGRVHWYRFCHHWRPMPAGLADYVVGGGTRLAAMVEATLNGLSEADCTSGATIVWVTDGEARDYHSARALFQNSPIVRSLPSLSVVIIGIDAEARERDLVGIADGQVDLYRSVSCCDTAVAASADLAAFLSLSRIEARITIGSHTFTEEVSFDEDGKALVSMPADVTVCPGDSVTVDLVSHGNETSTLTSVAAEMPLATALLYSFNALHVRVRSTMARTYKVMSGVDAASDIETVEAELRDLETELAEVMSLRRSGVGSRTTDDYEAERTMLRDRAALGDAKAVTALAVLRKEQRRDSSAPELNEAVAALTRDIAQLRRTLRSSRLDQDVLRDLLQAATTYMGHRSFRKHERVALRAAEQHVGEDAQLNTARQVAADADSDTPAADFIGECWLSGATEGSMRDESLGDVFVFVGERRWYNSAQVGTNRWLACPAASISHVCLHPVSAHVALEMLSNGIGASRDPTGRPINAIVGFCGPHRGRPARPIRSDERFAALAQPVASFLAAGKFGFNARGGQEFVGLLAPVVALMTSRSSKRQGTALRQMASGLMAAAATKKITGPLLPSGEPSQSGGRMPVAELWCHLVQDFVRSPEYQTTAVVPDPFALCAMAYSVGVHGSDAAPSELPVKQLMAPVLAMLLRQFFQDVIGSDAKKEQAACRLIALGDPKAAVIDTEKESLPAYFCESDADEEKDASDDPTDSIVIEIGSLAAGTDTAGVSSVSFESKDSDSEGSTSVDLELAAPCAGGAGRASDATSDSHATDATASTADAVRDRVSIPPLAALTAAPSEFPAHACGDVVDSMLAALLTEALPVQTCRSLVRVVDQLARVGVVVPPSAVPVAFPGNLGPKSSAAIRFHALVRAVQVLFDEADAADAICALRGMALTSLRLRYNSAFRAAGDDATADPAAVLDEARRGELDALERQLEKQRSLDRAKQMRALERLRLRCVNAGSPLLLTRSLAAEVSEALTMSVVPRAAGSVSFRPPSASASCFETGMVRNTWLIPDDPMFLVPGVRAASRAAAIWGGADERGDSDYIPDFHRHARVAWRRCEGKPMYVFCEMVLRDVGPLVAPRWRDQARDLIRDTWVQLAVHEALHDARRVQPRAGADHLDLDGAVERVVARGGPTVEARARVLARAFRSAEGLLELRRDRRPVAVDLRTFLAAVEEHYLPRVLAAHASRDDGSDDDDDTAALEELVRWDAIDVWIAGTREDVQQKRHVERMAPMATDELAKLLASHSAGRLSERDAWRWLSAA